LPARYNLATASAQYVLSWFRFDNARNEKTFISSDVPSSGSVLQIPPDLLNGTAPYFGVDIRSNKQAAVSLFIRRLSTVGIVGIERTWHVQ
jgi:hypothetical protein